MVFIEHKMDTSSIEVRQQHIINKKILTSLVFLKKTTVLTHLINDWVNQSCRCAEICSIPEDSHVPRAQWTTSMDVPRLYIPRAGVSCKQSTPWIWGLLLRTGAVATMYNRYIIEDLIRVLWSVFCGSLFFL